MSVLLELCGFALIDAAVRSWFGVPATQLAVGIELLVIGQIVDGVSLDPRPLVVRFRVWRASRAAKKDVGHDVDVETGQ